MKNKKSGVLKRVFAVFAVSGAVGLGTNAALAPETPDISEENAMLSRNVLSFIDNEIADLSAEIDMYERDRLALSLEGAEPETLRLLENMQKEALSDYDRARADLGILLFGDMGVTPEMFREFYPVYESYNRNVGPLGFSKLSVPDGKIVNADDIIPHLQQCRIEKSGNDPDMAYIESTYAAHAYASSVRNCAMQAEERQDTLAGFAALETLLIGSGVAATLAQRRRRKETEEHRESDRFSDDITGGGSPRKAPAPKGPAL